jgi:hypothetical protein
MDISARQKKKRLTLGTGGRTMSKLIVEMEYPNNGCSECRLKYKKRGYGGVFYCFNHLCVDKWTYGRTQNGDRPSWCPIVGVLPEEHGDLIDRDELLETCIYYDINPNKSAVDADNIQDMPVIIAAERKDDGTTAD